MTSISRSHVAGQVATRAGCHLLPLCGPSAAWHCAFRGGWLFALRALVLGLFGTSGRFSLPCHLHPPAPLHPCEWQLATGKWQLVSGVSHVSKTGVAGTRSPCPGSTYALASYGIVMRPVHLTSVPVDCLRDKAAAPQRDGRGDIRCVCLAGRAAAECPRPGSGRARNASTRQRGVEALGWGQGWERCLGRWPDCTCSRLCMPAGVR